MKCDEIIKKLSTYLDNELEDNIKTELENHLKTCLDCRLEYETLVTNTKFMRNLPEIEPSPYFIQQTLAKINHIRREKNRFFIWIPVPAMSVLLVLLFYYFLSFGLKVSALEPETRNRVVNHTIENAVKGYHILGHVSFKRFCKKSCDILCECKTCPMKKEIGKHRSKEVKKL